MAAELLSFFRPAIGARGDWSAQEIAEFYRVEAALVQAGVSVIVDRGISDEGDPWFVFCRVVDNEVIVHFARIAGQYVIATEAMGQKLTGTDFRGLLTEFVSRNPTLLPIPPAGGAKLLLHPASLLAAVVATALYYMSGTEAVANSIDCTIIHRHADEVDKSYSVGKPDSATNADFDRKSQDQQLAAAVVAMIALATADFFQSPSNPHGELIQPIADASLVRSEGAHLLIADDRYGVDALTSHFEHLLAPAGHTAWHEEHTGSGSITAVAELAVTEQTHKTSDSSSEKIGAASQSLQEHLRSNGPDSSSPEQNANPSDPTGSGAGISKTGIPLAGLGHQLEFKPSSSHSAPGGAGSSTSDIAVSSNFDAQTTLASINSEAGFLHQPLDQINLTAGLSIEQVVVHTANDLFGSSSIGITRLFDVKNSAPSVVATSLSDTNLAEHSQASNGAVEISSAPNQTILLHYPLFNDEASAIITSFVRLNSFESITSGRNTVLFDVTASDFASPELMVKTWSMHDGSTISIVGILPHDLQV